MAERIEECPTCGSVLTPEYGFIGSAYEVDAEGQIVAFRDGGPLGGYDCCVNQDCPDALKPFNYVPDEEDDDGEQNIVV